MIEQGVPRDESEADRRLNEEDLAEAGRR
jgi:hypothetical protein